MIWKVCRVRDIHTARFCADVGADMIGLHAIHSLPESRARKFARIARELAIYYTNTKPVLVTKVISPQKLADMLLKTGIKYLQLHIPLNSRSLKNLLSEIQNITIFPPKCIAVIAVEDPKAVQKARELRQVAGCIDYVLIDSSYQGGTGKFAPQKGVQSILSVVAPCKALIAGGLSVENVIHVIERYNPAGVDVQSGLEMRIRGRPKNPKLLIRFSELVKGRDSAYAYVTPPRPLVSLAMSSVSEADAKSVIQRFRRTDIDLIHLDHSDGSVAQASPVYIAQMLHRLAPCLPYDVHLFLDDEQKWEVALKEYLTVNPLLRVAFLHCEGVTDISPRRITAFTELVASLRIGLGIAIHSTKFDANTLLAVLSELNDFPIKDVSLVTHSSRHPLDKVKAHDVHLLKVIISWAMERRSCIHVSVDRSMNIEKLKILGAAAPSHVIIGSKLLASERPQLIITQFREFLKSPFGTGVDLLSALG